MNDVVLSKIESQPFGIALENGAWKLLKQKSNLIDSKLMETVLKTIEHLCIGEAEKENNLRHLSCPISSSWNKLLTPEVGNFIKEFHPNLQLEDISLPLELTLFTHIMAKNINYSQWYGGNAGSVHFGFDQAKMRTISEILERTHLSQKFVSNIWSSAVAVSQKLAESNAKFEALERWIITRFWLNTGGYEAVQCLDLSDSNLFQAVTFEWERYNAKIKCFPIKNPFGIPVVVARIEVQLNQQSWIFYGNGCAESLPEAAEKGLMETLQFLPRKDPEFYVNLNNSQEPAKKRVREWSQLCSFNIDLHSNLNNHSVLTVATNVSEAIDEAFIEADFNMQIEEIPECPGIFIAYTTHKENWNTISGVPIA